MNHLTEPDSLADSESTTLAAKLAPSDLREAYDYGATITQLMRMTGLDYAEIRTRLHQAGTRLRTDDRTKALR